MIKAILQEVISISKNTVAMYDEKPPANAKFPYATVLVQSPINMGDRYDYAVAIDIWDNNTNTTRVNNITQELMYLLEGHVKIVKNKHALFFGRAAIQVVPDPDPKIRRRRLGITVRSYIIR